MGRMETRRILIRSRYSREDMRTCSRNMDQSSFNPNARYDRWMTILPNRHNTQPSPRESPRPLPSEPTWYARMIFIDSRISLVHYKHLHLSLPTTLQHPNPPDAKSLRKQQNATKGPTTQAENALNDHCYINEKKDMASTTRKSAAARRRGVPPFHCCHLDWWEEQGEESTCKG